MGDFVPVVLFIVVVLVVILAMAAHAAALDRERSLARSILVCGATGVGKSTLINTLAGRKVADTGIGSPVTQNTERLVVPDKQLIFYDSRGLEVAEASQTYLLLLSDLLRLRFTARHREQIDLVLMCIQDPQNRYDDAHREIAALCEDLFIPYGIAITKWEGDDELNEKIKEEFGGALFVLAVRSLELAIGSLVIPAMGVDALLEAVRNTTAWTVNAARMRSRTAIKTDQLSAAARELAATHGDNPGAWIGFGHAATTLLDRETRTWRDLLGSCCDRTRRHYVPNVFVRNLFTKFDIDKIASTHASHLVPAIIKRFGDGTRQLNESDLDLAWHQAMIRLEEDRPYRSRF